MTKGITITLDKDEARQLEIDYKVLGVDNYKKMEHSCRIKRSKKKEKSKITNEVR